VAENRDMAGFGLKEMWERAGKKCNSEMGNTKGRDRNVKVLTVTYVHQSGIWDVPTVTAVRAVMRTGCGILCVGSQSWTDRNTNSSRAR
jgi:hypothetical protein